MPRRAAGDDAAPKAQADPALARLGQVIRGFRGTVTQTEIGRRLGKVPQTTISRWEMGLVDLTVRQVYELEFVMGLPHGSIGRAAGFVDDAGAPKIDLALSVDPALTADLRPHAVALYGMLVELSATRRRPKRIPAHRRAREE